MWSGIGGVLPLWEGLQRAIDVLAVGRLRLCAGSVSSVS